MRPTIIVATLALLVTACGGSDNATADESTTLAAPLPTTPSSSIAVVAEPPDTEARGDATATPVNGCALVTKDDAEALFGGPAIQSEDDVGVIQLALTGCIWEWNGDDGLSFQLLQLQVYDGPQFYGEEIYPDVEPLDVGDRGFISIDPQLDTVTVQFVSGGTTVAIDLSGFGAQSPDVATMADEMRALARTVHERLP